MKYNNYVIELPIDEKAKFDLQEKINHNQLIYYLTGMCVGLGFAIFVYAVGGW